jgi:hypothetical protein
MTEAIARPLEVEGSRSLWSAAGERLLANRAAVLAATLLAAVLVAAFIGPWVSSHADGDCRLVAVAARQPALFERPPVRH